jgi:hypothetical protein
MDHGLSIDRRIRRDPKCGESRILTPPERAIAASFSERSKPPAIIRLAAETSDIWNLQSRNALYFAEPEERLSTTWV